MVEPSKPSLFQVALSVLNEPDAVTKAQLTFSAAADYAAGLISLDLAPGCVPSAPDTPARPANVTLLEPRLVGAKNRKHLLHALVHAESYAIDLSWDIIARFGWCPALWSDPACADGSAEPPVVPRAGKEEEGKEVPVGRMPDAFFSDWVRVAAEEAKHYSLWNQRLEELGAAYGDYPGHSNLWDAASASASSLPARLALVHLIHESRGLDTYIPTLSRLEAQGDAASVAIIKQNHEEEIGHVRAARVWMEALCAPGGGPLVYQALVRRLLPFLPLRGPFNTRSRARAGFTYDWWGPLTALSPEEVAEVEAVEAEVSAVPPTG